MTPRAISPRHRPVFLAAAIALTGFAANPAAGLAQSPSISVTDGTSATVPGTYESGTYSSVAVSGTGVGGRSTLSIGAPVTLDPYGSLSGTASGLIVVNADVTSEYGGGIFDTGGTLELVSGTLSLGGLTLYGSGAFQRSGGSYAIDALTLSNGAVVTFTANDLLGRPGSSPAVSIDTGATLELQASLSGLNAFAIFDPGSTLARSTTSATINVAQVGVFDGASLSLVAGDSIGSLYVGNLYGSGSAGPSTVTLAPGTPVFSLQYLSLGPGGTVAGLESTPYSVQGLLVAGQRVEYRAGAITDTIAASVDLYGSGTLSLQQALTLSGSSAGLSIDGAASVLERSGHAVSTPSLTLANGASLTVGDGISVSRAISLNSGTAGLPTQVTLAQNLVLSAEGGLAPGISISGTDAGIVRSSPGLTITATGAIIDVANDGSLAMQAGDTFTNAIVSADSGGIVSNAGPQTLASLSVTGSSFVTGARSTYTAHGPLVVSGSTSDLQVSYGGRFVADANVTADSATIQYADLALLSGTLTISELLVITGSESGFGVNRSGGAAYDVAGLLLSDGATADFDAATDRIGGLDVLNGAVFTTGTTGGGLILNSLSIGSLIGNPQSQLVLGSFGGSGGPGNWGLRTPDTLFADLQGWIGDGSILALGGQPLTVRQQGGFAYVMAVPEPAAWALGLAGLACGWTVRRRRRKRPA